MTKIKSYFIAVFVGMFMGLIFVSIGAEAAHRQTASQCQYAGKVRLDGNVYTCALDVGLQLKDSMK